MIEKKCIKVKVLWKYIVKIILFRSYDFGCGSYIVCLVMCPMVLDVDPWNNFYLFLGCFRVNLD